MSIYYRLDSDVPNTVEVEHKTIKVRISAFKGAILIRVNGVLSEISAASGDLCLKIGVGQMSNDELKSLLDESVETLKLDTRTASVLKRYYINYIGELVRLEEIQLLRWKNFGNVSLARLRRILADKKLKFGMDTSGWSPPAG